MAPRANLLTADSLAPHVDTPSTPFLHRRPCISDHRCVRVTPRLSKLSATSGIFFITSPLLWSLNLTGPQQRSSPEQKCEDEEPMNGTMGVTKWLEVLLWMPLLFFHLGRVSVMSQGHFPRMENIAAFKPVSTSPARSSCGDPGRSSYCRAPPSPPGLASCARAFCDQECPWRSSTAPYAPLLLPAHRGLCVAEDPHDGPPGPQRTQPEGTEEAPASGQGSLVFNTTPGGCLVSPPGQDLGPLGSLTLAVWIKPSAPGEIERTNHSPRCGVASPEGYDVGETHVRPLRWAQGGSPRTLLLEKSSGGRRLFALTASDRAVVLLYGRSGGGPRLLSVGFRTAGRLAPHRWTHLVLQLLPGPRVTCHAPRQRENICTRSGKNPAASEKERYRLNVSFTDLGEGMREERCQPCACDPAGALDGSCHPDSGVCVCKALVTGDRCHLCVPGASHMTPDSHLGCSKAPSQQPPPVGLVLGVSSIRLSWPPPDSPNSHRLNYTLLRDGTPVYSLQSQPPYGPVLFEDAGLSPYTSYSYWLRTGSVAGETLSAPVTLRTLAAAPDATQLQLRLLGGPGPGGASFNWTRPQSPAGPVERFVLSSVESSGGHRSVHHRGPAAEATAAGLTPYTFYSFTLEACSSGGCSSTRPLTLRTAPAPPRDQPPPRVNATGPRTLNLTWDPPEQPNGVITQYEVFLRGPMEAQNLSSPANERRVFTSSGWPESDRSRGTNRRMVPPPESSASVTGLQPFSTYQMRVASVNTAGHVTSEWATARTTAGAPEFVSPPKVSAVSSSSLRVSWNSTEGHGVIARGTVWEYRVSRVTEQSGKPYAPPVVSQVLHRTNASSETEHVVEGLGPYRVYNFTLTLCTSEGCITSPPAAGRTLPAAPVGLSPPRLSPVNETTIDVEWSPPAEPNGPPPVYQVERTDVSLSDPRDPVTRGTRFPGHGYYLFPGPTLPVNTDYTGIQLSFRSRSPDGLLLCAFSPGAQDEFLALQIQDGRPYFLFDPQDSAVAVGVQDDGGRRYDDGEWHSVTATRHGAVGTIIVDHQYQGRAGGSSLTSIIGETTGLYVGGLPAGFPVVRQRSGVPPLVQKSFSGCLRDVKLKHAAGPSGEWQPLDWSTAVEKEAAYESWEGCPLTSEEGAHFLGHGYLELDGGVFSGGRSFDITLAFRTDQLNAILLFTYSHQADDFMLVELESGLLYFTLSWGGHVTELSMWVGLSYCDGEWNQLSLAKRASVISAAVNDWEERLSGAGGDAGLSVDSSVYLGGVPTDLMHPALARNSHRNGLGGCLRRLTVRADGAPQPPVTPTVNLSSASRRSVRVELDGCSPGGSRFLCRGNDSVLVYSGRETLARDAGLQPFTEYLYRCVAVAEGGWSAGPWERGRSRGTGSVLHAGRAPVHRRYPTCDTVADHVAVSSVTLKSYTVYTE
ncbi:unnamed protein product, partial [Boreogadus saida]